MLSYREELGPKRGQATLLLLGMLAVLLAGTLVLFGFGQALGARSKHQRSADLVAVSAAQVMRRHYTRLFEVAAFENGEPNPRHLSNDEYLALARQAALRGARRAAQRRGARAGVGQLPAGGLRAHAREGDHARGGPPAGGAPPGTSLHRWQPSSTSARPPPTTGCGETTAASASSADTPGSPGTTA